MKINYAFIIFILFIIAGCKQKQPADKIFFNGKIYTVDDKFSIAEAFAIKDGKVLKTGTTKEILEIFSAPEKMDLQGKSVYPGFIDAHCHFYGYGLNLGKVSLEGTKSYKEVIEKVVDFAKTNSNEWILGRGWDQNDWEEKQYPDKAMLDVLFPHVPVFLQRIDGHAALVNQAALDKAHITADSKFSGGEAVKINGKLTGVLIDNAVDSLEKYIPKPGPKQISKMLLAAQVNCFAVGLTTVDDAGLDKNVINIMDSLQKKNELKMRIYAMANPTEENKSFYFKNGKYKSDRLNVFSFKIYADGALGSRGACLLKPYDDKLGHVGFLLHPKEYFSEMAKMLMDHGFQMNTHCIGDSANRFILNVYGQTLKGKNDKRWRIEHAQVLDPADFQKFGSFSVIPSVQPTHATSDMYWAEKRIGNRLIKAYAYKRLLLENGLIANGSDFPVENINPLFGFYAAVARRDQKNFPAEGFQPENGLDRTEALKAMTIWAAYANFEEKEKGSLEKGKFADFVILDQDLMKAPSEKLWQINVLETWSNGEKVYKK